MGLTMWTLTVLVPQPYFLDKLLFSKGPVRCKSLLGL